MPSPPHASTSVDVEALIDAQARVCAELQAALEVTPASNTDMRTQLLQMWSHHQEVLLKYQELLPGGAPAAQIHESGTAADASGACATKGATADLEAGSHPTRSRYYHMLLEGVVLFCCALLVLYTFSGPRSVFATCSFAVGMHMTLDARGRDCEKRANLRPRLALVYLCHWSLDAAHLWMVGEAADAVRIAKSMLTSVWELALLFGSCTCLVALSVGPRARTAIGRTVAAQAVLALRVYLAWSMLPWARARADEYAFAAIGAQVLLPLATMGAGHGYACLTLNEPVLRNADGEEVGGKGK